MMSQYEYENVVASNFVEKVEWKAGQIHPPKTTRVKVKSFGIFSTSVNGRHQLFKELIS